MLIKNVTLFRNRPSVRQVTVLYKAIYKDEVKAKPNEANEPSERFFSDIFRKICQLCLISLPVFN